MNKQMQKLVKNYHDSHNKLMHEIKELPEYGNDCHCGACEFVTVTEYYQDQEGIARYCVNCGGNDGQ